MCNIYPNQKRIESNLENYRIDEINKILIEVDGITFSSIYSVKKLSKIYAIISLARMVFITLIMAISILFF